MSNICIYLFNRGNSSLSDCHSTDTLKFLKGQSRVVCFDTVNISSVILCQVQPYVV